MINMKLFGSACPDIRSESEINHIDKTRLTGPTGFFPGCFSYCVTIQDSFGWGNGSYITFTIVTYSFHGRRGTTAKD